MIQRTTLADSEWILMQIIWDNAPCTFRRICDGAKDTGWTKHVVSSYLKRMEAKGAIAIEDAKPVKLYRPLLKREDAVREETEAVLSRVYRGSPLLMVQAAVDGHSLTEEELDQLEKLLLKGCEKHE